jgi:hypothetical protein
LISGREKGTELGIDETGTTAIVSVPFLSILAYHGKIDFVGLGKPSGPEKGGTANKHASRRVGLKEGVTVEEE